MKKMTWGATLNKKAFTLIELLAVIVILAIIAVIAIPIVAKIVKDSKVETSKRSAENYIRAVEEAVMRKNMTDIDYEPIYCSKIENEKIKCYNEEDEELAELNVEIDGNEPTRASLYFKNNKIGKYEIVVDKNTFLSSKGEKNTICKAVTEETARRDKDGNVLGTIPIKGQLFLGDQYMCEVAPGIKYNFYVLKESTNKVDLIMYANINKSGIAVDNNEVIDKGLIEWDLYENNTRGPLKAMNYLQEVTSGWTNIETKTIGKWDNNLGEEFEFSVPYENMRARLPRYSDFKQVGAETSQLWLQDNLEAHPNVPKRNNVASVGGYWMSSALSSDPTSSYFVRNWSGHTAPRVVSGKVGIRPVITVYKSDLS